MGKIREILENAYLKTYDELEKQIIGLVAEKKDVGKIQKARWAEKNNFIKDLIREELEEATGYNKSVDQTIKNMTGK